MPLGFLKQVYLEKLNYFAFFMLPLTLVEIFSASSVLHRAVVSLPWDRNVCDFDEEQGMKVGILTEYRGVTL